MMAPLLGLSRKRVYYRRIKDRQDVADKKMIEDLHVVHPAYGHKRVALALSWSHNKAKRIMTKFGLKPPRRKGKKFFLTTSISDHHYTNLIKNIIPNKPGQIFVTDLTYLKWQGRNMYLATVEDIFTREIVSATLSDKHDSKLALTNITEAVENTVPEFIHFDQGKEFLAEIVTSYLENNHVKISVSDKGSPWQNGYKESFFGRFKDENGDLDRFESLGELIEEVYSYVFYYNTSRIHTSLKMPPLAFKRKFLDKDIVSQKSGT